MILGLGFVVLRLGGLGNSLPGCRQAIAGGRMDREIREPDGEAGVSVSGRPQPGLYAGLRGC